MNWNSLAYAEINKTELTTHSGARTKYYGLEIQENEDNWLPLEKPISENYLLVSNADVKDIGYQLANENNIDIDHDKERTVFNGKQFKLFLPLKNHLEREIAPGDTIRTGLMFQNSYDMSTTFGFSLYLERLICSNGMTGIRSFPFHKFRHTHNSADWMDEIMRTSSGLQATSNFNEVFDTLCTMITKPANIDWMQKNYNKLMKDIPSNLADPIIRNFYKKGDNTLWGLMNAGTDIMWHKKTGNVMASLKHNSSFVNNMLALS